MIKWAYKVEFQGVLYLWTRHHFFPPPCFLLHLFHPPQNRNWGEVPKKFLNTFFPCQTCPDPRDDGQPALFVCVHVWIWYGTISVTSHLDIDTGAWSAWCPSMVSPGVGTHCWHRAHRRQYGGISHHWSQLRTITHTSLSHFCFQSNNQTIRQTFLINNQLNTEHIFYLFNFKWTCQEQSMHNVVVKYLNAIR